MPLILGKAGETYTIKKISGKEETIRFIENLGFVEGSIVDIVSFSDGNVIVKVKDARVAIGRDLAQRIMV